MFQSAPLTEARGDLTAFTPSCQPYLFQSAPLTEARGDSAESFSSAELKAFQSAPLTEARGDGKVIADELDAAVVSIRSPHRSKGRRACQRDLNSAIEVSIRSPHRSKGRPSKAEQKKRNELFQSAPLTEARGDWRKRTDSNSSIRFNPLPSPKQGETESMGRCGARTLVSIRSPHRSKGRPVVLSSCVSLRSFNPLPSPKQGETGRASTVRSSLVSFQSAPLTEARGDAGRYNQRNNKNLHRHMRDSVK